MMGCRVNPSRLQMILSSSHMSQGGWLRDGGGTSRSSLSKRNSRSSRIMRFWLPSDSPAPDGRKYSAYLPDQ